MMSWEKYVRYSSRNASDMQAHSTLLPAECCPSALDRERESPNTSVRAGKHIKQRSSSESSPIPTTPKALLSVQQAQQTSPYRRSRKHYSTSLAHKCSCPRSTPLSNSPASPPTNWLGQAKRSLWHHVPLSSLGSK